MKLILLRIARFFHLIDKATYKKRRQIEVIRRSKYFDPDWYVDEHSQLDGLSPVEHYLTIGWKKGYNPSPLFDTKAYLKENPDVKSRGLNPLYHYEAFGKKETRIIPFLTTNQQAKLKDISPKTSWRHRRLFPKHETPKISVIVASYNYQDLIKKTLDSLVAQTYRNFEVIVVDDGSKDNSVVVIKQYVEKYPYIQLYQHEGGVNRGLPATLQLGLSKSTGKYVAFCESDDIWTPDHLAKKVAFINKYKKPKIIMNGMKLFGDIRLEYVNYINLIRSTVVSECFPVDITKYNFNLIPTFSCVMIDRKTLLSCDFNTPVPAWLDWWLYRQILATEPLYYIGEKLTKYRLHKSFNSGDNAKRFMERFKEFILLNNLLIERKTGMKLVGDIPDYQRIEESPYFDKEWYYKTYPEVAALQIPALLHYDKIGWEKGYNPSPLFNTIGYQTLYPDIRVACMNPLLHFIISGQKEGRIAIPIEHNPKVFGRRPTKSDKAILLVTHLLNHTGAPMLLLFVARVLLDHGYHVTVLSPADGDLRKEFRKIGATVIVDQNAYVVEHDCCYYKKYNFQFALCNTFLSATIYSFLKNFVPSILWIHDNLDKRDAEPILDILKSSKSIYVPSQRTKGVIKQYNTDPKLLSYPIVDLVPQIKKKSNNPLKIAVCAAVQPRKGQDIFVKAIQKLSSKLRQKAQFIIVGEPVFKEFASDLKQKTKSIPEIIWQECIKDSKAYHKFIDEIDVLCCPSREDPYPLVVIDAMMHGKPVIISDHVGQKDIITNGQDGFVFPSENVAALTKILEQLIQNGVSTELREKSRALFENRFSPDTWFKQFKKIMEDTCKKWS